MERSKENGKDNPYIGLLLAEDHLVIRSQYSAQSSEVKGFNFALEGEFEVGSSSQEGDFFSEISTAKSPSRECSSPRSLRSFPSWQYEIYEGFQKAGLLSLPAKIRGDAAMDRFYSTVVRAWALFLDERGLGSDVTISWAVVYHSLLSLTEPFTPSLVHAHIEFCSHSVRRYGQKRAFSKLAMTHQEFLAQYKDDPQSCLVGHTPSIDFFVQAGLIQPGLEFTPEIGFPQLFISRINASQSISLKFGALVVVCIALPIGVPIDLTLLPNHLSMDLFRFGRIIGASLSTYTVQLDPMKLDSQLKIPPHAMITISSSVRTIIGTFAPHLLKSQIFDSIKYFNHQAQRASLGLLAAIFKQHPACEAISPVLIDTISNLPSISSYFEVLAVSQILCKILSLVDPTLALVLPPGLNDFPIPEIQFDVEDIFKVMLDIKNAESDFQRLKQQILAIFEAQPVFVLASPASRRMVLEEIQSLTLSKRLRYLTDRFFAALSEIECQIQSYLSGEAFRQLRDLLLDFTRTKTKTFLMSIGFQLSLLSDDVALAGQQTKILENICLLDELLDSPIDRYHLRTFIADLINCCYQKITPFIAKGYDILSLATGFPVQFIRDKDPSVMHSFQSTSKGALSWKMKMYSELQFLVMTRQLDDEFLTTADLQRISAASIFSIDQLVRERLRRYRQELGLKSKN